tara:strand:- start:39 stop:305 length:267 start_codon:yes stop_codon:yes gene_type:complete
MKVKELIDYLKDTYEGDEQIIVSWMDYECFDDHEDVSVEAWNQTCIDFDKKSVGFDGFYDLIANYYLVRDRDLKYRENYVEPKKRWKP